MVQLPARRDGPNVVVFDPSHEFEDIYDRMGQLMGLALGEPTFGQVTPWAPSADVSENDDEDASAQDRIRAGD